MHKYRRITRADRFQIERKLAQGKSFRQIGNELGFNCSSISREIKRGKILKGNRGGKKKGEYSALESHRRAISTYAESRQTCSYRGYKIKDWVEDQIILKLHERWSPEQISKRLKEDQDIQLSAEAIYKYILSMKKRGAKLHKLLRHYGRRPKRCKPRSRYWELQKQRKRSIEARPMAANLRTQFGHWERDLMLGKRGTGAVLVFVDRMSQMTILKKLNSTFCEETNQKTKEALLQSNLGCKSITNDNGHEFGEFWKLEKLLGARVYFTHPLCPWERGSVENTIGLLRQFIPKGSDLREWTQEDLNQLENQMNRRPRKTLNSKTPAEFIRGTKRKLITKKKILDIYPEYADPSYWSDRY